MLLMVVVVMVVVFGMYGEGESVVNVCSRLHDDSL